MEVDVILLIVMAAGFLLGVLRGAIRQLIVLGACLVTFILAAYLRPMVGEWIAANTVNYSLEHVEMLAFALTFLVLFTLAVLVIEIGGKTIQLTQRVAVDEILGGFLALGVTILAIASLAIIFDSYYAVGPPLANAELDIARELNAAFARSAIVTAMHDSLIPGLTALLGPVLPADIRAVYP
ncbi:MAG: CvpA family protein [Candidatus Limnocylindrales bacterium]